MSRTVSLCAVTDAAFPLEIALQSPGVSDAALAAGPSSAKCFHSFLDSPRWLSNRTAWLFPLPNTLLPQPSRPSWASSRGHSDTAAVACWCLWAAFCEARWRCSRGLVRLWLCVAGWESSSASVTLSTSLPFQLNWWCSVGLVTLVTWIFTIWLLKLRDSTCRKMVVMQ